MYSECVQQYTSIIRFYSDYLSCVIIRYSWFTFGLCFIMVGFFFLFRRFISLRITSILNAKFILFNLILLNEKSIETNKKKSWSTANLVEFQ